MNIKTSLYYRAKSWICQYEKDIIAKKHSLKDIDDIPLNLLLILQSIKATNPEFNTLIDIGTHKGLFTKSVNLFFKTGLSICFEPNLDLVEDIKKNTKGFNVEIHNIALSSKEEEVIYYKHEDNSMNSIVKSNMEILKEKFPWDDPEKIYSSKVKSVPLDIYLGNRKLNSAKFLLKIDTQGSELEILKGCQKTLLQTNVCVIEHMFVNVYQSTYTFLELIHFMSENGFRCKGPVSSLSRPSGEISSADLLFIK